MNQKTISGLGLGLSIPKEISKRLGGKIHAESVVAGGLRCEFTLPILSIE